MGIKAYYQQMDSVRNEISGIPEISGPTPSLGKGLAGFWSRTKFSVRLILLEKELITFAVLQWACIAFGYYLWIQMIGWIPEAAWQRASNSHSAPVGGFILFLWSFFCVGIVAFPLGILSGCMGAVHFLNRQGKESTIEDCLKMVLPRAWPLWVFHWIDGWWTVRRILDRLPKKNDRRTAVEKALSEAIYYAWKIGTIGILPALVTGRGLIDAGKRSIGLVRHKIKDVVILRAGYSSLCWVVGLTAYAGAIFLFVAFPGLVNWKIGVEGQMYTIYFWLAVPILIAAGVVMLFLRPIFVISAFDIYADYVQEQGENLMLPPPPAQVRAGSGAVFTAVLLALALAAVVSFRQELGLMELLSR